MTPIPLIRAASALSFAEVLRGHGARIEGAWARAGLPSRALLDPEQLVPFQLVLDFTERAGHEEGLPDLGLRVARRFGFASAGRFTAVIRSAPTLHRAIEIAILLIAGHNSGARYWTVQERDTVRLCRRFRSTEAGFRQSDLLTIALMVDLVRLTAGRDWRPSQVELQSSGNRGLDGSELFSQARVDVGRAATSVTFPRVLLSRPLARPESPGPAGGTADWNGSAPPRDFVASLDVVIGGLLESERIDVATAASAAGLSVRSFQRRLADLGMSFSDAVDAVRLRKARELLIDGGIKIIEIAFALGYSDPAHFNRAFRRWTSLTPTEYRQLHSEAGAPAAPRAPAG